MTIPSLLVYLFIGYSLFKLAERTHTDNAWWGFIPLLNVLLIFAIAEKPLWWAVGLLVPLVNLVVLAVIWTTICERRRKPIPLGLLIFVPPFNLILIGYLAFSD